MLSRLADVIRWLLYGIASILEIIAVFRRTDSRESAQLVLAGVIIALLGRAVQYIIQGK